MVWRAGVESDELEPSADTLLEIGSRVDEVVAAQGNCQERTGIQLGRDVNSDIESLLIEGNLEHGSGVEGDANVAAQDLGLEHLTPDPQPCVSWVAEDHGCEGREATFDVDTAVNLGGGP